MPCLCPPGSLANRRLHIEDKGPGHPLVMSCLHQGCCRLLCVLCTQIHLACEETQTHRGAMVQGQLDQRVQEGWDDHGANTGRGAEAQGVIKR